MSDFQVESVEDRNAYQQKVMKLLRQRAKNLNAGGVLMGGLNMGGMCCPCMHKYGAGPKGTKKNDAGKYICQEDYEQSGKSGKCVKGQEYMPKWQALNYATKQEYLKQAIKNRPKKEKISNEELKVAKELAKQQPMGPISQALTALEKSRKMLRERKAEKKVKAKDIIRENPFVMEIIAKPRKTLEDKTILASLGLTPKGNLMRKPGKASFQKARQAQIFKRALATPLPEVGEEGFGFMY